MNKILLVILAIVLISVSAVRIKYTEEYLSDKCDSCFKQESDLLRADLPADCKAITTECRALAVKYGVLLFETTLYI